MLPIADSPEWFPWILNNSGEHVLSVRLTEEDYRNSSFLDHRISRLPTEPISLSWSTLASAMAAAPIRANWIFHISHVGSTLLSRLLGSCSRFFSLREPGLLRHLVKVHPIRGMHSHRIDHAHYQEQLYTLTRCWSRTYQSSQVSLIKATSIASELATDLLQVDSQASAIALYTKPDVFLQTMLGGAMTDMSLYGALRLSRLEARVNQPLKPISSMSPGELVAMSWLSEVATLDEAFRTYPDRILWMDFDHMLNNIEHDIACVCAHLVAPLTHGELQAIVRSSILQEYAKAPGHHYNAVTRQNILSHAAIVHHSEIHRGLEWLRRANRIPLIQSVLQSVSNHYFRNTRR